MQIRTASSLVARLMLVAICALAAACAAASQVSSPTALPVASPAPQTQLPVNPTPSPAMTVPQAVPTSVMPTRAPSPSPASLVPPAATLNAGSGTVAGELRSYCWVGTCVDAFELPRRSELPAMAIDPTAPALEFRLDDDAEFLSWSASYGDGPLAELTPLDRGGESYDPDLSPTVPPTITQAEIALPPPGDWILYLVIRAMNGEAHYAWHVTRP